MVTLYSCFKLFSVIAYFNSKGCFYNIPLYRCFVQGGRGEATCVIKCKLCSRENSVDILGICFIFIFYVRFNIVRFLRDYIEESFREKKKSINFKIYL